MEVWTKRLRRLDEALTLVASVVESLGPDSVLDVPLLGQYQEQLSGYKAELASIYVELLSLDCDDEGLMKSSRTIFDPSLKVKRLLQEQSLAPSPLMTQEESSCHDLTFPPSMET